jgi:hypothetical protein
MGRRKAPQDRALDCIDPLLRGVSNNMSRPVDQSQIFLDSVGINFNRDVYIHGVPQQFTTGVTIYAHSLTKPSEGKHPTSYAIPSPVPNLQEQRPDNPDKAVACIFVGMTLSPTKLAELRATYKSKPTDQKRKVRGMSVVQLGKEGDIVEATMYDPNALRVVAKKSGKTACFYALMNPDEKGLCLGVLVPSEDVFFFKSCRDDNARTVQARKDTFGAKIRDFMAGHGANGPTFAAIKRKWIKEEDSDDGVRLDRSQSLSAEDSAREDTVPVKKARLRDIMGLLLTAQEKGDKGSLAVAINEMRAIDQTEAPTSPPSGLFTSAFLPPLSITNELCVQVLSDIKVRLRVTRAVLPDRATPTVHSLGHLRSRALKPSSVELLADQPS